MHEQMHVKKNVYKHEGGCVCRYISVCLCMCCMYVYVYVYMPVKFVICEDAFLATEMHSTQSQHTRSYAYSFIGNMYWHVPEYLHHKKSTLLRAAPTAPQLVRHQERVPHCAAAAGQRATAPAAPMSPAHAPSLCCLHLHRAVRGRLRAAPPR